MARHVLVVEDDQDVSDLLTFALAGEGHHVVTASTIEEAIQACESQTPDVITLDIALRQGVERGLEGLGLIDWCASRDEPRPKIIVVSAARREVLDEVRVDPRVLAVLAKPFELAELLALVDGSPPEQ